MDYPRPAQERDKNFFEALFDLSFASFITPKLIKVLYVLAMIGIVLMCLVFIVAAFRVSSGLGVVTLIIGAPLAFLFYVILIRVYLELVIALFRVAENTTELVNQGPRPSGRD